jgi:hypothetical protein
MKPDRTISGSVLPLVVGGGLALLLGGSGQPLGPHLAAESGRAGLTAADSVDWTPVDRAMGRPGAAQPGGVHKFSLPRGDLTVRAGGVTVAPALALGSWVGFKPAGAGAVAMGDLVLVEREVAPVMARLEQGGIQVTALHNHLLYESPRVMYLHIHATGDPVKIAQAVAAALALTGTPPAKPAGAAPAARFPLDTLRLAEALGHAGKVSGGVYQVSVPRSEAIRDGAIEIPASMGVATGINFQPTGGGRAAATGDFVLTGAEVNPVIRALNGAGIQVTALHSHMLAEEPRLLFMHFWAQDDALKLARGLRNALEKTNSRHGTS